MKYWALTGIGFHYYEPISDTHDGWQNYIYLIKAADIESAYKLFDSVVGHNYFEGFKEAVKAFEAADVDLLFITGPDEAIWRTARYGPNERIA